jgi:pimeloyl-ACP methyl ester carboxylesterase
MPNARLAAQGGGNARGAAWEAAALEGRGGYATDSSGRQWFYCDAGPVRTTRALSTRVRVCHACAQLTRAPRQVNGPPLVLLHGLPAFSFMWRGVVAPLAAAGRRVIALDLLGAGNSAKPAPGTGAGEFPYTLDAYVSSLESVLFGALKLPRGAKVDIAAHGVLGGLLGALLAARCAPDVRRLALLNASLEPGAAAELPQPLRFLLNPLLGPMMSQNPLALVGTPIQSGGPFVVDGDDTAAYIAPALGEAATGWAAISVAKTLKKDGGAAAQEAARALGARGDEVLLIWGIEDKWLGKAPATPGVLPRARRLLLEGAGHFAAEDWPQKVADALLTL